MSTESTTGAEAQMKARDLIGRRVRLVVHDTPCRVRMPDHDILTETVSGRVERLFQMPGGPMGTLLTDDGKRIAFDAGADVACGKIEIEVSDDG